MKHMNRTSRFIALVAFSMLLATLATPAQETGSEWKFALAPYLWGATIHQNIRYDNPYGAGQVSVSAGPKDYLKNLEFGALVAFEARKGKWALFTDVVYLDLSSQKSVVEEVDFPQVPIRTLDLGSKTSMESWAWTLGGSYRAFESDAGTFEVLAGFRYLDIRVKTHYRISGTIYDPYSNIPFYAEGTLSKGKDSLDGIVGIKGRVHLGSGNWYMPYYLDVGTGSANFTWQGLLGIDYSFGAGDLRVGYRHLDYDFGGENTIQDMRMSGPMIGFIFRF